MTIFWRFVLAHLLADFPLQSKWFIQNKGKTITIAIHSLIHFTSYCMVCHRIIFDDTKIILAAAIIAILHFFIDLAKSHLSKKDGTSLLLFTIDQIIHISIIITVSSFFFLNSHPLQNLIYFRLSIAVIAIWTLPIVIMLWENHFSKKDTHSESFYWSEDNKRLRTLERGLLIIGIAGGFKFFPLIIAAILTRWLLITKGENFPIWTWSLVSILAFLAKIWSIKWFALT